MPGNQKAKSQEVLSRRLEQYCLTEEDLEKEEELVVPCRSFVALSGSAKHPSYRRPRILQTKSLDELKRWIGVDDRAVKGHCLVGPDERREIRELCRLCVEVTKERVSPNEPVFATRVKSSPGAGSKVDAIRSHTRAYLYGDSSLVAQAKPVIESFFLNFEIFIWLFPKIKVSSGSVLAFGPGANALTASELEIEEGGQVVSYGSLTANVGNLRKTHPINVLTPLDLPLVSRTVFPEQL